MLILEEPYVSPLLVEWAAEAHHPVLGNAFARALVAEGARLDLVGDDEAAARIDAGERVYSNSENALDWVLEHAHNESLARAIAFSKDKSEMRDALAPLTPGLFYRSCSRAELADIDPAELPLPVVLKPAVGFCSMGVYTIASPDDWEAALADIDREEQVWAQRYPGSVVDTGRFVVEGYIAGQEYAIDMYYDAQGRAQCLNVMRHDFASADDTSDRLYNTSHEIVAEMAPRFERWLDEVNDVLGARDFPAHVEVRVDDAGDIVPVEFNPLRFAGLGGTDLAYWAWGLRTYEAFLEDAEVDVAALSAPHAGKVYTMSLLNPHPGADLSRPFLYDAFAARFSNVLDFHRFDANAVGSYGFLFLQTDEETAGELDFLLRSDLLEFQG